MPTPFPVDPVLTGISVAFRNTTYVADSVLPRLEPENRETFRYWEYPPEESFIIPDTHVGRRGRPNEVTLSATEKTAKTQDYGLDDPIPQSDIEQAPAGKSPVDRAVAQLTDYLLLDREKRTADLVFNAASYGAANKTQLSGTSQWSDYANSNPIDALLTAIDAAMMRPNVLLLGNAVWIKLRQHPKVVQAIVGQAIVGGAVSRQAFADFFELEELLIGQSFLNTAKKGQPASLGRVWGKHGLLFHRNRMASGQQGVTFGFTYQFLGRIAGSAPDKDIGARGGVRVRVAESVKELIVAPQAAFFIQDAVA